MGEAKLDRRLNIVLPVDYEGGQAWVHSMPISRTIFRTNYKILAKTFNEIYGEGYGPVLGPRIAMLVLRDVVNETVRARDNAPGAAETARAQAWTTVDRELLQEIWRLTTVVLPKKEGGWQTVPYSDVQARKTFEQDILDEVENTLVYFIVASALHRRDEIQMALEALKSLGNVQVTSLTVTEYKNSLTTSTAPETIGKTESAPIVDQPMEGMPIIRQMRA